MKSIVITIAAIVISTGALANPMHDACSQAGAFNSVERAACEAVYAPKPVKVNLSVKPMSACSQALPFNSVEAAVCVAVEAETKMVAACEDASPFNSVEAAACKAVYTVSSK